MSKTKKQEQIEEAEKKIKNIDQQLIADPQNKQLKTDKAILSELITFLENKE